ncbi:MAG: putative membrane protein [Natronomonas sp.]
MRAPIHGPGMVGPRKRYKLADTAQQLVGGFLLAGPFVVTEEVWVLAANMTPVHAIVTVGIVVAIGYGALYEADADRDPEREAEVAGVPLRFVSLMGVSFGSVVILALAFTAPETFLVQEGILTDPSETTVAVTTLKAISVGAIFSVVGAATADSVF